jgi:F-type H+-transporting ATPase subunit b
MRTRVHNGLAVMLTVAVLSYAGTMIVVAAQPEHTAAPPAAAAHAPAGEHAAEAEHGSPFVGLIAKLFNFALFAGTLVYFLRSPFAGYLSDRGKQIRSDLVKAAQMKQSAAEQLAKVDAKMAALPGELDALRRSGADEVVAEEARIRQAADAERARLIEQAKRDIDWQLKIAERDLKTHAAALAVDLATTRVKATITDADQLRLVDRYVAQVGK